MCMGGCVGVEKCVCVCPGADPGCHVTVDGV